MDAAFLDPSSPCWSEVLAHLDHDVYHLPGYAHLFAEEEGGKATAFVAEEGGRRFFVPLIVRSIAVDLGDGVPYFDATCPYGYPGPLLSPGADQDFLSRAIDAMLDGLRERRVVTAFIRMHPLFPLPTAPLQRAGCLVQHGETVCVNLDRTDEEHWHDTRKDHRKDINKLRRAGHVARIDEQWEHLDTFVEIYHETMARLGASDFYFFPRDHFLRYREALDERAHLSIVEVDGRVVCAGIVTELGGIVQNHFSGTRTDALKISPPKLRTDFLRRWARERGNRLYHLGGGFGGQNDALFAFKAGFSKERAPFATWRVIADQVAYRALNTRWEADHGAPADEPAGFFPAYRRS